MSLYFFYLVCLFLSSTSSLVSSQTHFLHYTPKIAVLQAGRERFFVKQCGSKLVIGGGSQLANQNNVAVNLVEVYDPMVGGIVGSFSLPGGNSRYVDGGFGCSNQTVIVAGGQQRLGSAFNNLDIYNLVTKNLTSSTSVTIRDAAVIGVTTANTDRVYIIGGSAGAADFTETVYNTIRVYDSSTASFLSLPSTFKLSVARSIVTAAVIANRFIIAAGGRQFVFEGANLFTTIDIIDTWTNTIVINNHTIALGSPCGAMSYIVDQTTNKLYLAGGYGPWVTVGNSIGPSDVSTLNIVSLVSTAPSPLFALYTVNLKRTFSAPHVSFMPPHHLFIIEAAEDRYIGTTNDTYIVVDKTTTAPILFQALPLVLPNTPSGRADATVITLSSQGNTDAILAGGYLPSTQIINPDISSFDVVNILSGKYNYSSTLDYARRMSIAINVEDDSALLFGGYWYSGSSWVDVADIDSVSCGPMWLAASSNKVTSVPCTCVDSQPWDTNFCRPCPLGTSVIPSSATSGGRCSACSAGSYASSLHQAQCTPCGLGYASSVVQATSSSVCQLCPAGTHGNNQASLSRCLPCPALTYNPNAGSINSSACLPCATNNVAGAAACPPTTPRPTTPTIPTTTSMTTATVTSSSPTSSSSSSSPTSSLSPTSNSACFSLLIEGTLIFDTSSGAVYLVIDHTIRHVPDPATFANLFVQPLTPTGATWDVSVSGLPQCVQASVGAPIPSGATIYSVALGSANLYNNYLYDQPSVGSGWVKRLISASNPYHFRVPGVILNSTQANAIANGQPIGQGQTTVSPTTVSPTISNAATRARGQTLTTMYSVAIIVLAIVW